MTNAKYAFQGMKEGMAKAMKRDAELSMKVALEMSSFLKGRTTTEAKTILERVLAMTQAIPYKKYNDGVGHRKGAGMAAGRYPQKGAVVFTELIASAEANAQAKGLSTDLKIIHIAPQKASRAFHSGRQRRRQFKRVHIEMVVQEVEKDAKSKPTKKSDSKKEVKKEEKKHDDKKEAHHEVKHESHEAKHEEKHAESSNEEAPKKKRTVKKKQEQEDKQ
jgi:large subunit ribosomal protein L22